MRYPVLVGIALLTIMGGCRHPTVCGVLVRINSPGGEAAATDLMWHELQTFRTTTGMPVVAYLVDVATGGGYFLATAADMIYAHPATVTGGIRVILNLYNLQDTMAQLNVLGQPIKAGKNIDMGTSARASTPEVKQWFQGMADELHQRFKQVVVKSRPQ